MVFLTTLKMKSSLLNFRDSMDVGVMAHPFATQPPLALNARVRYFLKGENRVLLKQYILHYR
jgi:hypothetical protein